MTTPLRLPANQPSKVGVYLRTNTNGQASDGSIAAQKQASESYCHQHGLAVHNIYTDTCVSGMTPLARRTAGKWLLNDARVGEFDTIVLFRLDRLGRDTALVL